ncbi:NAD(+) diphosphatase [Pengzhenrongella sp.]|uniref:NAD(+) diphosphatase n=1 Tax=Pengzhenrongella sp. TaxID=2888820 RepID=UPI002F95B78C
MDWTDLPLARATIDRASELRARPDLVADLLREESTRVVLTHGGLVATTTEDGSITLDLLAPSTVVGLDLPDGGWLYLGTDGASSYVALVLADPLVEVTDLERFAVDGGEDLVAGREWSQLRRIGAVLDARDAGLATTAVALAAWHKTHPRCPRCGTLTDVVQAGWVRHCPADGSDHYPRTDPAVIMAVVDEDDRLLLGHAVQWPEHRLSTLAGYVEPGEAIEHAVRREVAEEVGVVIGEVSYRGSQPWPFPASLMLAFRARALTTQITVDGVEVTEAQWFTRAELVDQVASGEVLLPMRSSIARVLIEEWFGGELAGDWGLTGA